MKSAVFLPAKSSSDRIENKNLRPLDGKPLFLHTLEKLITSGVFDEVWLDTDSPAIAQMAVYTGCKVMIRDASLATNKTDGHKLLVNEALQTDADLIAQVLCTSPFISRETMKNAVDTLKNSSAYDSAVLVRNERFYFWNAGRPAYDLTRIPNSVDLPISTFETMGFYLIRREVALSLARRIGERVLQLPATPLEAIDVNWPEDLEVANLIAAGYREKERKLHSNISRLFTSCLLSDLLDDAGYPNQVIRDHRTASSGRKILGRAKTLKLRELLPGEDFRGIYGALFSYETIVPGDIIMVENELPDYAYFGELNANLAIRSGALGAVVGGCTRDSSDVDRLDFPVFARGFSCQDVRKRATVDHINQPIKIGSVTINPGDLVFCDNEGIVVIPRSVEKRIIEESLNNAANERHLLADIAKGVVVSELTKKYGNF